MADQNYGDSQQAVQVFYPATATQGTNLVPASDISEVGRMASVVAGSNRYTVTSISFAPVSSGDFANFSCSICKSSSIAGLTQTLGGIPLGAFADDSAGNVFRVAVAIDLLPGEVCFVVRGGTASAGSVSITFDGYTSNFGPIEGEVEKPSGSKVINVTGEAEITPVVLIADVPEESGDE